jgi:hypothetical protein
MLPGADAAHARLPARAAARSAASSQLLPANWSGGIARQLCEDIYRITYPHAQQHLLSVCETANGPLPPAAPYFYERFGGLQPPAKADRRTTKI